MPPFELVGIGAAALYLLGALVLEGYRRRRLRHHVALWREAAREAGLATIAETDEGILSAKTGALRVRFSQSLSQEGGTRLEIDGRGLAGLTLRPEPRGLLATRSLREIELGDDDFDREVSVQGLSTLALAVLDAPTRHAVRTLLRGPFQPRGHRPLWITGMLDDGLLRIDVPPRVPRLRRGSSRDEPEQAGSVYLDGEYRLPEVLRAALDFAGRLVVSGPIPVRLRANLAAEPQAGVRRRLLLTLLRDYPDHPATREAVEAARDDEDAEVRLRAGVALGDEGRDVLLGVAGGEGAEDKTSAAAVNALGATLALEQVSELLRSALRTRRLETAGACLGALGRHGEGAVAMLARVLLVERGDLGTTAAASLAETGSANAEPLLVRALRESAPEVRRAAAVALGRVGTREAVLPLREAEAEGAEPELRGAARQAVAEIHARLAGAGQGQLSLAGGEAGQLTLSEGEAGRLSFSQDQDRGGRS